MCVCTLLKANPMGRRVRAHALKGKENFTAKEQQKQSRGLSIFSTSERHFIQYHFPFRVHAHSDVDELLVEERHADLQAPRRRRLVGTQAVVLVQGFHLRKRSRGGSRRDQNRPESKRNRHARACRGDGGYCVYLAAGLLVELLLVGSEVEVEVAAEELVGALTGQHHLHPQRLDLASHQEHGRAGTDRRHVVGLVVVDHLLDRVDAVLLWREKKRWSIYLPLVGVSARAS